MRAKLSIETTGVRGTLIFEGEAAQVGKQLRQLIDLLAPVEAGSGEAPSPTPPPAVPSAPAEESERGEESQPSHEEKPLNGVQHPDAPGLSHLSFSTLALLFRCAHAFHLKQAGIKPPPSEDQKLGTDFHAGIAAFLRGDEYIFEYPQNATRFGYVQELLTTLRSAPDLAVEAREVLEAGGIEWVGYADAIANGAIYEFKATKRLPTAPFRCARPAGVGICGDVWGGEGQDSLC
jgi:hypothetical protein